MFQLNRHDVLILCETRSHLFHFPVISTKLFLFSNFYGFVAVFNMARLLRVNNECSQFISIRMIALLYFVF